MTAAVPHQPPCDFAVVHLERDRRVIDFEIVSARPLPANPLKRTIR